MLDSLEMPESYRKRPSTFAKVWQTVDGAFFATIQLIAGNGRAFVTGFVIACMALAGALGAF